MGTHYYPLLRKPCGGKQPIAGFNRSSSALGIACGRARLTLGGEYGQSVSVERGDVLVLPAGTGHRCIECSDNFLVVGAYPLGQEDYDIQRPDRAAHPRNLARIAQVLCPEQDPVCGIRGMLLTQWR